MDGNGMRTAHVEARQEPECPARLRLIQRVVCGSLEQQRPRLRAVAYRMLCNEGPQHLIR